MGVEPVDLASNKFAGDEALIKRVTSGLRVGDEECGVI